MGSSDILEFYGWWQLIVCLFAFISLMGIWYHIGKKQNDLGQVYLALSVLCWSLSGLVTISFSADLQLGSSSTVHDGLVSILSLFNSLFILLALPWFRYIPEFVKPIIKSKFWILIVGLPFLFSLMPTLSKLVSQDSNYLIRELDVYYSIFTLLFLGFVLWESFMKRRLIFLAYLSVICIMITFGAQILKMTGSGIDMILLSAIFKTCLIMIFFALALSWVKELAENIIPESESIKLKLTKSKDERGKFQHKLSLGGFPGVQDRELNLTPALYDLLDKFSRRRLTEDNEWLEIKPKNNLRPGNQYDINDHNEVRRLIHSILDGLFGKYNWTKDNHEVPFRRNLFELSEKRERKIRLRIPKENITIV